MNNVSDINYYYYYFPIVVVPKVTVILGQYESFLTIKKQFKATVVAILASLRICTRHRKRFGGRNAEAKHYFVDKSHP